MLFLLQVGRNNMKIGINKEGSIVVIGPPEGSVDKIFITAAKSKQLAPNEFNATLNRFGSVSEIKNSDFQNLIERKFTKV